MMVPGSYFLSSVDDYLYCIRDRWVRMNYK